MAATAQVTVTTTAAKVVTADGTPVLVWLRVTATDTVWLGGADVTTSNGIAIADGDGIQGPFQLGANEDLYGVVGADTATLQVLRTRAN
jgi:hypothetical protein